MDETLEKLLAPQREPDPFDAPMSFQRAHGRNELRAQIRAELEKGPLTGYQHPMGTCDWGECDEPATEWRWSENDLVHLPVCEAHELEAEVATLTAERDGWRDAALEAGKLVDKYRAEADRYREALEDMAWQHAYRVVRDDGPYLSPGGVSVNEEAFELLGWKPLHHVPEMACDIEGCVRWRESGLRWGDLYLSLCSRHSGECFAAQERPPVKASAIQREALRDKDGILPINWERALAGTGETDD